LSLVSIEVRENELGTREDTRVRLKPDTTYTSTALAIIGIVLLAVVVGSGAPRAQTADPENVAAGMRIFRTKADCQACHGWAGDGRKMDSQMPDGANLRLTKLDRDKIIVAIKCGIPGKSMPAFDRLAYSDGRCYGMKEADLKRLQTSMPDPAATLQPREIEMLADFLFAKVIGQGPMDRAKCIEYWGSDVEACKEFPK
jgi:cbb3-type cytochrome c oxidase subunit III